MNVPPRLRCRCSGIGPGVQCLGGQLPGLTAEMLDRVIRGIVGFPTAKTILDRNRLLAARSLLFTCLLAGEADQPCLIVQLQGCPACHTIHLDSSSSLPQFGASICAFAPSYCPWARSWKMRCAPRSARCSLKVCCETIAGPERPKRAAFSCSALKRATSLVAIVEASFLCSDCPIVFNGLHFAKKCAFCRRFS